MADAYAGEITVRIPELEQGVRPTVSVVDAHSLELVATGVTDEQFEVPPGQYVVSSIMPSGERAVSFAEVTSGDQAEASLSTTPPPSPASDWTSLPPAPTPLLLRPVQRVVRVLESLGVRGGVADSSAPVDVAGASDSQLSIEPFFMRFVGLRHGHTKPGQVDAEIVVRDGSGSAVELTVTPHDAQGVVFAQLLVDDEPVLNVALPASGKPGSVSCRLSVSTEPLTATVSRPENPTVDAVGRYLNTGNLREAAAIAVQAERLLQTKTVDPFGAALGAFALLRMGDVKRLHEWPRNLANWFRWLPDGAIVAGELSALRRDHVQAVDDFCTGAERGLPVFADGFSMLTSRLRQYAQADTALGLSAKQQKQLTAHASRLVPLSPLVDFARVSLAIRGARLEDPLGSLEERPRTAGVDGWSRFSPLSMTLERSD